MSKNHEDADAALDRTVARIQAESIAPSAIEKAGERVWGRLLEEMPRRAQSPAAVEQIRGCSDVQTLIPFYVEGSLSESRALLVADHTRECIACRRALREARAPEKRPATAFGASGRSGSFRYAIAASLLLTAIAAGSAYWWWGPVDARRSSVHVQSVDGALYRVHGNLSTSVAIDEEIPGGEVFRTAKGSRAVVLLADGSRVEMNERSELSVSARRSGTSLNLTRGSIIVEAAKQGSKHLFVAASDCRVSVTGTIFSVNHGTKGSRVSVIEGEVRVRHSGAEAVLHPGDQMSTSPSLEKIPLASEIAWSQHADRHLAVLAELSRLSQEIDAAVPHPEPRHATRLLDLAPERTMVYVALPNVSETLGEAHRLLRERIQENPVLRPWWEETMAPAGADARLDEVIDEIQAFGEQLGEEIVVTVGAGEHTAFEGVLVMAELQNPAEFRTFLESEVRRLDEAGRHVPLALVEDPRSHARPRSDEVLFWIHDDLLVAATSLSELQAFQNRIEGHEANGFVDSQFHADIARSYRDGTTWLLAVNMKQVLSACARENHHGRENVEAFQNAAGLSDARNLIVEGKEEGGKTTYRGVLSFDQARRGIASWLAAPAPMGSLEFLSPDATLAAAFVAKNPLALAHDVFDMLQSADPDFGRHLAEFETQHGVNVLQDLAAPLGGEFAFALDGPLLPKPAWKLVVEVYDPARLTRTIEWAVGEANRVATGDGDGGARLSLSQESSGDRTYYTLRSERFPIEVHYTFVDGYLIAAPARSLLDASIALRSAGASLAASSRFRSLLPEDGNANFSAVAYQNLGSVLGPLAGALMNAQDNATSAQQRQSLAQMIGQAPPSLTYAYGEQDRIVVASTRPGGMFGSDVSALLGLHGLLDMKERVESAASGEGAAPR